MFGYDHPYNVEDHNIILSHSIPNNLEQTSEHGRTVDMIRRLIDIYEQIFNIGITSDSNHFCPFKGGGDVAIFKTGSSSAGLLQGEGEGDEVLQGVAGLPGSPPGSVITPPKQGEYRCGTVENKMSNTQTEDSVNLQLRANMLLLCTKLLVNKILQSDDTANIKVLTCYGLQLGLTYKLKLLKLNVDFNQAFLQYEELFELDPCAFYPVYIDISIFHVLESLK